MKRGYSKQGDIKAAALKQHVRRASEWGGVDAAGGWAREVYCSAECETRAQSWTRFSGGGDAGGNAEAARAFLDHAKARTYPPFTSSPPRRL